MNRKPMVFTLAALATASALFSAPAMAAGDDVYKYIVVSIADAKDKRIYLGGGRVQKKSKYFDNVGTANCSMEFRDHLKAHYNFNNWGASPTEFSQEYDSAASAEETRRRQIRQSKDMRYQIIETQYYCTRGNNDN